MTQSTHQPAPHGKLRNELLGNVHANARKLGYDTKGDRRDYEAVLDFLIGDTTCIKASLEQLRLVDDAFSAKVNARRVVAVEFTPLARTVSERMSQEQFDAEEAELIKMLEVA